MSKTVKPTLEQQPTPNQHVGMEPAGRVNVGFESLVIAGTAVALASVPATADSFWGVLQTAQVMMRGDGTDPTATVGIPVEVGQPVILNGIELADVKFIRTGTSGLLTGHYYNQQISP